MKLAITDKKTGGDLILLKDETDLDHLFYSRDKGKKYFTIAWNRGSEQTISDLIRELFKGLHPHPVIYGESTMFVYFCKYSPCNDYRGPLLCKSKHSNISLQSASPHSKKG